MKFCLLLASLTLCLGASWAVAQEPQPADRLAALEAEVAALREALASLQSPETGPDLSELARRIDLVAAELETLKLGEVAVQADRSLHGLGPAASKVYQQPKGVSIGGYGEMVYQNFAATNDAGAPSAKTDEIDLLRGVVYVGYKWSDRWLLNTDLEWEHSSTGMGGEASVEFAYVYRLIRPEFNVRAGLVLLPMGLLNELHEPTVFLGARRPGVENAILPTTWRENGVGVFGEIGGLSGSPQMATITAVSDCMVVVLSKEEFRHMLFTRPGTVVKLMEDMSRVIETIDNKLQVLQEVARPCWRRPNRFGSYNTAVGKDWVRISRSELELELKGAMNGEGRT